MAERIDRPRCQPNPRSNWTTVLAGRVLRPLSAQLASGEPDHSLHRGEPGFSGSGGFGRALALVQRWMAGENACPTKPSISVSRECRNSSPPGEQRVHPRVKVQRDWQRALE